MSKIITLSPLMLTRAEELMAKDEKAYQDGIEEACRLVLERNASFIFLAGPSCSGKTTTGNRLKETLEKQGKRVAGFSTDDFFFNAERAPRNPDGTPNYDSPEHTDFDLICHTLSLLEEGKTAQIPVFDFLTSRRTERTTALSPKDYDVFVLEGIHALNDRILSALKKREKAVCLYLSPTKDVRLEGEAEILSSRTVRFCRRLIRDFKHRGASAQWTFTLWRNVVDMERLVVEPFIKNADRILKTDFTCEIPMEKNEVLSVLSGLPKDSEFYEKAQRIARVLAPFPTLPTSLCRSDSVLKEFID